MDDRSLHGAAVGTAYQVYDGCVDLFGTEAEAGKSLGTDVLKQKSTLPVIRLLEQLPPEVLDDLRHQLPKA